MDLDAAIKIFDHFYKNMNGHSISLEGREKEHHEGKAFVYGEIIPESFYSFLLKAHPAQGEVFYDLGSGTGKAVFLAYLLFNFSESKGIELVKTLFEASNRVKTIYAAHRKALKFKESKIIPIDEINKTMSFVNGSFLEVDFSNADIIYMNSTCWPEELIVALHKKLSLLKKGTRILSVSTQIKSDQNASFTILNEGKYRFSWGEATVFTSIKTD